MWRSLYFIGSAARPPARLPAKAAPSRPLPRPGSSAGGPRGLAAAHCEYLVALSLNSIELASECELAPRIPAARKPNPAGAWPGERAGGRPNWITGGALFYSKKRARRPQFAAGKLARAAERDRRDERPRLRPPLRLRLRLGRFISGSLTTTSQPASQPAD